MTKKYISDFPNLMSEWDHQKNTKLPSEVSSGSHYRAWWRCLKNHEWDSEACSRVKGSQCRYCTRREAWPGETDIGTENPKLADELVDQSLRTKLMVGARDSVDWRCKAVGHIFPMAVYKRGIRGDGCPYCSGHRVDPSTNDIRITNPIVGAQIVGNTLVTKSSGQQVTFQCVNGHTRLAYPYNRLDDGSDCPGCANVSLPETFLQDSLKPLVDIITNSRSIIPPKELDIFIPTLNIAIEYNGLYFHSDVFKDKNYHLEKSKLCWDKDIQLIHVWEDENVEIVLRMLSHKLGVSKQRRVSGSKTKVSEITGPEASAFLNENHIQGRASGSYYLGLREKKSGELVAVMVLKRTGNVLSLERYATSAVVMGGQSKLLSWVDKNIEYTQMVTFADLSISDGSLYEKTGWTKDKVLAPDYRYVVDGKRIHKFNYRLKRFRDDPKLKFEEGMSESQLAKLNGIPKIYDCGKIRYTRSCTK